jgi:hypothetical protein
MSAPPIRRRRLLATLGAVALTVAAAVAALGANLGLFGLTDDHGGPGHFPPVSTRIGAPGSGGALDVVTGSAPSSPTVPITSRPRHAEGHERVHDADDD